MADKAGDKFTSGGYSYVLNHGPKGNLRPYYQGRSKGDASGGVWGPLITAMLPVFVAGGIALYDWWRKGPDASK
jgi:hypothetical protein